MFLPLDTKGTWPVGQVPLVSLKGSIIDGKNYRNFGWDGSSGDC